MVRTDKLSDVVKVLSSAPGGCCCPCCRAVIKLLYLPGHWSGFCVQSSLCREDRLVFGTRRLLFYLFILRGP